MSSVTSQTPVEGSFSGPPSPESIDMALAMQDAAFKPGADRSAMLPVLPATPSLSSFCELGLHSPQDQAQDSDESTAFGDHTPYEWDLQLSDLSDPFDPSFTSDDEFPFMSGDDTEQIIDFSAPLETVESGTRIEFTDPFATPSDSDTNIDDFRTVEVFFDAEESMSSPPAPLETLHSQDVTATLGNLISSEDEEVQGLGIHIVETAASPESCTNYYSAAEEEADVDDLAPLIRNAAPMPRCRPMEEELHPDPEVGSHLQPPRHSLNALHHLSSEARQSFIRRAPWSCDVNGNKISTPARRSRWDFERLINQATVRSASRTPLPERDDDNQDLMVEDQGEVKENENMVTWFWNRLVLGSEVLTGVVGNGTEKSD